MWKQKKTHFSIRKDQRFNQFLILSLAFCLACWLALTRQRRRVASEVAGWKFGESGSGSSNPPLSFHFPAGVEKSLIKRRLCQWANNGADGDQGWRLLPPHMTWSKMRQPARACSVLKCEPRPEKLVWKTVLTGFLFLSFFPDFSRTATLDVSARASRK